MITGGAAIPIFILFYVVRGIYRFFTGSGGGYSGGGDIDYRNVDGYNEMKNFWDERIK